MAFGYEYWIVHLPKFKTDSFLLFVHNPAGSTKLRDYSSGKELVLGQPRVADVRDLTEWGKTRFEEKPHVVSGPDGERYWQARICEYNRGLKTPTVIGGPSTTPSRPTSRVDNCGRAFKGSQRQIQDYVNLAAAALNGAIVSALPTAVRQSSPTIRWISPLASEDYRELRDGEFLSAVGLDRFSPELKAFWPESGPCWDALGALMTSIPGSRPVVLLLEAKSHVAEIYGNGCQAGGLSRPLIEKSLEAAKNRFGARADADWTGPLYQSANRIAHLHFLQHRLNQPCFLVNLYFVNDPYRPTGPSEWSAALEKMHHELGITNPVPGLVEVLLPAFGTAQDVTTPSSRNAIASRPRDEHVNESGSRPQPPACLAPPAKIAAIQERASFSTWCRRWEALGAFQGRTLPDPDQRIALLRELWTREVPGQWQRNVDAQLLGPRYRRGDLPNARPGEHAIEYQILVERFETVRVLGGKLIDGVNAFPLACDFAGGGRSGNVEADMLLATQSDAGISLVLCEVKSGANNPWHAAVELLRQLRLFLSNPVARQVMQHRGKVPASTSNLPVTALVVAPPGYYCARGKKSNTVAAANLLFEDMRRQFGIDLRLAAWDPGLDSIRSI